VFDLGGPSNRVAIFAENDHGPQPCESLEYTIFLTDNPQSQEVVLQPTTTGADPQKWNRAVLSKVFTKGFVEVRAPDQAGHGASCGDTDLYSVEEDSFVQVFSLPCGITFRYAAVVAGNDGLDFPACAFDSSEAELDGVVGLTEEGAGVCPDADKDGFVDCNCPGAPAVCDCNDADAAVHPGASEKCDDSDRNCDGAPGACGSGLVCFASVCVPTCNASGEFSMCPPGSSCEATDAGKLCVPKDCSAGGCPAGSVCDVASGACRPACDGVVCPHGQVCRDGACADPCTGVVCPNQQVCEDGSCRPRCACFQADVGCPTGLVCDRTGESACVTTDCQNVTCAAPQFCDMGQCVSPCTGATCPIGQKCEDATGACVPKCQGVTCASGETCEPATGQCVSDGECNCLPPSVCVGGTCVVPDGGAPSDAGAEDASAGDDGGGPHRGPQTADEADADSGGGCGCRVAPARSASRGGLAAAALLLAALGRRRRRGAA
jgi:MYXO-CTERM domain-containing protein